MSGPESVDPDGTERVRVPAEGIKSGQWRLDALLADAAAPPSRWRRWLPLALGVVALVVGAIIGVAIPPPSNVWAGAALAVLGGGLLGLRLLTRKVPDPDGCERSVEWGIGMVIEPGDDLDEAWDRMGDKLAAAGVRCPNGVLVNQCCGNEENCTMKVEGGTGG